MKQKEIMATARRREGFEVLGDPDTKTTELRKVVHLRTPHSRVRTGNSRLVTTRLKG